MVSSRKRLATTHYSPRTTHYSPLKWPFAAPRTEYQLRHPSEGHGHGEQLRDPLDPRGGRADVHLPSPGRPRDRIPAVARLPFSLKILLENLLRNENGLSVRRQDIEALARWNPKAEPDTEIAFTPARVLLQDFTGVPCVVDLAAMRDAMADLGGDPAKINPLIPCELVIDHSVQVDDFGTPGAFANNTKLEYERNRERYTFLRWGQTAFRNFKVVPPETGIVHQVNLEYLARVVFVDGLNTAYPDTLVGTDSHTTMINGLGVLGWGVGGIEAEAAMLGQPVTMLIPQVIGFKLYGKLGPGGDRDRPRADRHADAPQEGRGREVRRVLRRRAGRAAARRPGDDRQHGPRVRGDVRHLPGGRRDAALPALHRPAGGAGQAGRGVLQGTGDVPRRGAAEAAYSDTLELDLATVVPSLAGPTRPQDRVALPDVSKSFAEALPKLKAAAQAAKKPAAGRPA